jgi:paraquat-inducible protein B
MKPIKLSANHSFTLWTRAALAALVTPAGATTAADRTNLRLPGQSFTLWTHPGRVDRIAMRNAPAPAREAASRPAATSRWLPIAAAACLALAGFFGMKYYSEKSQRETVESDYAALAIQKDSELSTANLKAEQAANRASIAESDLKAKEADLTGEIAKLKTSLTAAGESAKKAAANATETSAALERTKTALADAKKEHAAKETTLQNNATALTEEISKVKRVAGEESSKAKETVAKLEEEKAAAVKEAAAAMADRDILKEEVEKLRKQLETKPKAAGAPEA